MNTDFKSFEEFFDWKGITISVLAYRCLDVKEELDFWSRTRVYSALLAIIQDVYCYGDNAKLINDFLSAVKAKETELDALYNAAKAELNAKI